jgi:hypothetical protein
MDNSYSSIKPDQNENFRVRGWPNSAPVIKMEAEKKERKKRQASRRLRRTNMMQKEHHEQ